MGEAPINAQFMYMLQLRVGTHVYGFMQLPRSGKTMQLRVKAAFQVVISKPAP